MKWWLLIWLLTTHALQVLAGPDFEFVVIGDTRPRFESESFRPFEGLIARINGLHPALVVNLGDLIYGYGPISKDRQWDKYDAVIKTLQVPYYQTPGNHDTHSRAARRVYARRFSRFYQSFDAGDCHFVLVNNSEDGKWGYVGPAQLDWLRADLARNRKPAFVLLHFPVWEPERITPAYYEFWAQTLHPLFRTANVRAVFGGHYHTYGPTREFDGIRYFITGGGGAELRPEYRKAGGEFHFLKVHVSGSAFEVRVVTEHGELSDAEADVMGGLQFASRNVSRIGLKRADQGLQEGARFSVSVRNPNAAPMTGSAFWVLDASAFSVQPPNLFLELPPGITRRYDFTLRTLRDTPVLQSLPRLEFNVVSGGKRQRFQREVRFLQELTAPWREKGPVLDGDLEDWQSMPELRLDRAQGPASELRACRDDRNLYLALAVPTIDREEWKESGLSDEVQIGFSRRQSESDFGADLLRVGLNSDGAPPTDRTPGRKPGIPIPGAASRCRSEGGRTRYELALPLKAFAGFSLGTAFSLVIDLSFPEPEPNPEAAEKAEPVPNSFAYSVRYGADSLVPVNFVELQVEPKKPANRR